MTHTKFGVGRRFFKIDWGGLDSCFQNRPLFFLVFDCFIIHRRSLAESRTGGGRPTMLSALWKGQLTRSRHNATRGRQSRNSVCFATYRSKFFYHRSMSKKICYIDFIYLIFLCYQILIHRFYLSCSILSSYVIKF